MRKVIFNNFEFYHVYNRGVDGRDIFIDQKDYKRMLDIFRYCNDQSTKAERVFIANRTNSTSKLSLEASKLSLEIESRSKYIDIISYCLNSNHFHILLVQNIDNGIAKFMHKLGTSYTKYFNIKNERSGALFEGTFKAIHVETEDYLLNLFAYVTGNNIVHGYTEDVLLHEWNSIHEYKNNSVICNTKLIKSYISDFNKLKDYVNENCLDVFKKRELEKYLIDSNNLNKV